ncbi:stage V sporulation protein D (sporulation-specific penicillin-binding protein) [Clostridium acetobutylicum]|nr:penicillin-binding transpeptidase domain-containing protein [Clostridium acetobutylicum]ADZ22932.1 Stage V sporulation protein D, penicillin-binding protein [Clostridium acetobutylicum EA 2018]NOV90838.1 stage V sporulation protein D (sporulation-specific penicillin-binding protein) [Clostridium acetobutylicum]NOW16472.1 stage V sporulation protein D (sporulation-specific penicillin-binding protein) [Clostridium acetobutylicum]NRY58741.1 stage V sporulation protein D (sporulation-specific pe
MIDKSDDYKAYSIKQWKNEITIAPKRGDILDCNGDNLATSLSDYRIDVDMNTLLSSLKSNKMTLKTLSTKLGKILGESSDDVYYTLSSKSSNGVPLRFVNLVRQINKEKIDRVKALKITGFIYSDDFLREYPNNNFLSSVLGYLNSDGNGASGVELSYNKILSGTPGHKIVETDVMRNQLPYGNSEYTAPKAGKDIVLTIDKNIQLIAEQAAEKALSDNKAKSVTITVMNPNNGEILAMVSKPDFNPNIPNKGSTNSNVNVYKNTAVENTFEPGSIFKVITSYAALAEKVVNDNTIFTCNGSLEINKKTIHCWEPQGHGREHFVDIIKNSCNVGFMELGVNLLGKNKLYKYEKLFGFGEKTGVDLPDEAAGIVRPPSETSPVDLANNSFGQGVSVTSVEYLAAFNAIANGGTWIRPHVMKEIVHSDDKNSKVIDEQYSDYDKKMILDPAVASNLRKYLIHVVNDPTGVGKKAAIPGYDIAGKTGTAQKADPKTGGYETDKYIASFAGMAPANKPRITLLISVDEPDAATNYYASTVAAPVAKDLYIKIFDYLALEGIYNISSKK